MAIIDILRKRYVRGEVVTLFTKESAFTGIVTDFEDVCVILSTANGEEYIPNEIIMRISLPGKSPVKNVEENSHLTESKKETPSYVCQDENSDKKNDKEYKAEVFTLQFASEISTPKTNGKPESSRIAIERKVELFRADFKGEPEIETTSPDYSTGKYSPAIAKKILQWKSQTDYALKIKEYDRITKIVKEIGCIANSEKNRDLYELAGNIAVYSKQESILNLAEELYNCSARLGNTITLKTLALIKARKNEWDDAVKNYFQYLNFLNRKISVSESLILGQLAVKSGLRKIEGLGLLIDRCDCNDARENIFKLIGILISEKTSVFELLEQRDIDSLRSFNEESWLFQGDLEKKADKSKAVMVQPNLQESASVLDACKGKLKSVNSLEEIHKLFSTDEMRSPDDELLSANGTITRYFANRNFGFLTDKNGYQIWFGEQNVVEEKLIYSLKQNKIKCNIPVVFSISVNYRGDVAAFIHKPKTVQQTLEIAHEFYETKRNFLVATGLVEQVLSAYPQNKSALAFKQRIIGDKKDGLAYCSSKSAKSYDYNYQKAKRFHNNYKNYTEALKYYMLAFENNEKKESCIKDIAMLYVAMGEQQKAHEFMLAHEAELPGNITTYNYLENFFASVKNYVKVIQYIDLLLGIETITKDKQKHSIYLSKKGSALIQLAKFNDAKNVLEKAKRIYSGNTSASRLLEALESPDTESLNQIIADAEFDSFGGKLGLFFQEVLNSYEEYHGVPPKIIDSGGFSTETLSQIRWLIANAGRARPRERANYLLTEAKLLTILNPEDETTLRSALARYCNAMALNHISENSPTDVIRFYYLEAFNLEEKYHNVAPQVALYLLSNRSNYSDMLAIKTPSIDEALVSVINESVKDSVWESILSMFLWNRSITANITSKLFSNACFRKKSLDFLMRLGFNTSLELGIEEYSNLWNQAREKRQRDYIRWLASIRAIANNINLETLTSQLVDCLNKAKYSWLPNLDSIRLKIINSDIFESINDYLCQSGYRNKERSFNIAKAQLNDLVNDIEEKPTKLSYEGFLPLLEKIDQLLEKSFRAIEEASKPKVKASIHSESSVVGANNNVTFQIKVENSKDSSPIHDLSVWVKNTREISFFEENNEFFGSIDGGSHHIFKLRAKISESILLDKAATIEVECKYKIRNQEEPERFCDQISLRLHSEEEFLRIDNPYAPLADGGPVRDKKMFYGRDSFIDSRIKAILSAHSKQIIIYGQKRSGKSSVLFHMKEKLEETGKAFCISFSLGEIIKNLNEHTFFYKIISSINRALKIKKANGMLIPAFNPPSENEFKLKYGENPANGFIDLLEDFHFACQAIDDWKFLKLVIMIDEFTYLYTAIRRGDVSETIMKQWKAITQCENIGISVVLVGQDVVPTFKKEDYAKNAFGVIEDIRLTYLEESDARLLIEEPILNNGKTRFIGSAVNTILEYTSRNPYYIQIFCARLVEYMNMNKVASVTEADIREVAETFIEGNQALAPEKFDNLIRAGEEHDFVEFDDDQVVSVLRQIAANSKNIGFCSRDSINLNDQSLEESILEHLSDREVIEKKQGDNYKIQVRLFQEWLLKH